MVLTFSLEHVRDLSFAAAAFRLRSPNFASKRLALTHWF
jgi:hypothetical protein